MGVEDRKQPEGEDICFRTQRPLRWQKALVKGGLLRYACLPLCTGSALTCSPHFLGWPDCFGEMVAGQNKQVDDYPLAGEDKGQSCMPLDLSEVQGPQAHLVPCSFGVCGQ